MTTAHGHGKTRIGVLAGGAGTRAGGEDKGWLLRNGRPQVLALVDCIERAWVAAGRDEPPSLLLSANRCLDRYLAITDQVVSDAIAPDKFPGPLVGVARLLGLCSPADHLITVPVDTIPDASLLRAIAVLLEHSASTEAARLAVIHDLDAQQPLLACYPARLAAECDAVARRGERSVRRWQQSQDALHIHLSLRIGNCNLRSDYDPE